MAIKRDIKFSPEFLFIEEDALDKRFVRNLLTELPGVTIRTFRDQVFENKMDKSMVKDYSPFTNKIWTIRVNKGHFVKDCPGTNRAICCGYSILNIITGCPMGCTYCILQDYLNSPYLTIYANPEDLLDEIVPFINKRGKTIVRFGTGELSDSLALDPLTRHSNFLIPFFSKRNDAILELKTKTDFIDHILDLPHGFRTVISWSMNPENLIKNEEFYTASIDERIEAASRCQKMGYPVGLHFDPMIWYEGWENDYRLLISKIFKKIDPRGVIWISLGTFRFPPSLKSKVEKRWPTTRIFLGELFLSFDGKMRYLKAMRIEMYRRMLKWLRDYHEGLFIYLCMESEDVWKRVFGWSPISKYNLDRLFHTHILNFFKKWECLNRSQ